MNSNKFELKERKGKGTTKKFLSKNVKCIQAKNFGITKFITRNEQPLDKAIWQENGLDLIEFSL